jgi:hypothetical protein
MTVGTESSTKAQPEGLLWKVRRLRLMNTWIFKFLISKLDLRIDVSVLRGAGTRLKAPSQETGVMEALAKMQANVDLDAAIRKDNCRSIHVSAAVLSAGAVVSICEVEVYKDGVTGLTQFRV